MQGASFSIYDAAHDNSLEDGAQRKVFTKSEFVTAFNVTVNSTPYTFYSFSLWKLDRLRRFALMCRPEGVAFKSST